MKRTPLRDGARVQQSETTATAILADRNACPNTPDCRRQWRHIATTETAECGHCYQTLTRSDLARILADTA